MEQSYHPTAGMSWLTQTSSTIGTEREGGLVRLAETLSKSNMSATAGGNHCKETMNLILTLSEVVLLSRAPQLKFLSVMY